MSFRFMKADFFGDKNIGLYGFATDSYCLLGTQVHGKLLGEMSKALSTEISHATIANSDFIGIFSSGNSNGMIVSKLAEEGEIRNLRKIVPNVLVIGSKETALGNLILCNDRGCLISKRLGKYKKEIEDTLGCEASVATVAGLEIVGSAAAASSIGCVCHSGASEEELMHIEKLLKVRTDVGTVGFGNPFIRSGLIVNSKGVVVSDASTGAEIGRCDEIFNRERL
ncbi:MAG TPA: translation initiation factor IF-6 [archaeon]|nr:translation initiation factor IF-6 [archaeon]